MLLVDAAAVDQGGLEDVCKYSAEHLSTNGLRIRGQMSRQLYPPALVSTDCLSGPFSFLLRIKPTWRAIVSVGDRCIITTHSRLRRCISIGQFLGRTYPVRIESCGASLLLEACGQLWHDEVRQG